MDRTLEDAINLANKQREELPHIVQVIPSDYDRIIMADRIAELQLAVKTLNDLWTKEYHRVNELEEAYLDISFQLAKYKARDNQNAKYYETRSKQTQSDYERDKGE